jgi:hypothetical protein
MAGKSRKQTLLIWILTVVITIVSAAFQRLTGPTYPARGSVEINGEKVEYKLIRSHYSSSNAIIEIGPLPPIVTGELRWKRVHSKDEWIVDTLARSGNKLVAEIPKQPPAGKVAYDITLTDHRGIKYPLSEDPVVIRFKGEIPTFILILHVIIIFTSMLLGTRTGFEALFNRENPYRFALWTTVLFFVGGLILGPVVQNYAFGSFWTGWPLGSDLTDNKTAVAVLGWLVALWRGRNPKTGRKWIIIAAAVQLVVFLIPHSLLGSEFDYTKMSNQP